MPTNPDGESFDLDSVTNISRRKWLAMAGAGITSGLAGCNNSGAGDGNGGPYWTAPYTEVAITKLQWNVFNPLNYGTGIANQIFDPLGVYSPKEGEFVPVLAEDWSFDREGGSFTLSIRDQTWSNGDPVSANDVMTKLKLMKLMGSSGFSNIESISTSDNKTVELQSSGAINQEFLMFNLFGYHNLIDTPESDYGTYLEDLESASSDSETQSARESLASFRYTEPTVNGPFEVADKSSQKLVLETRESGNPAAEELNFAGLEFSSQFNVNTRLSAISNQQIDHANINATQDKLDQLPDHVEADSFPWFTGIGLSFNYERDVFEHRAFRKALAYLMNRSLATRNVAPMSNTAHQRIHGMTGVDVNTPQQILGNAWDSFQEYGYDASKTDEATAILEEAGFTKNNGRWHKPNGDKIEEIQIVGPSGWSWIRMVQTATELFSDFGIPSSVRGVDAAVMYDQVWPQQDYDMVACELGGASPYPGNHFRKLFTGDLASKAYSNPTTGMPLEFELTPVGDPDGSTSTVNIQDKMEEISTARPEDANGILQEIAWLVNQAVPVLPVYDKVGYKVYDTREWQIPAGDDAVMQMVDPTKSLPTLGVLQANEK